MFRFAASQKFAFQEICCHWGVHCSLQLRTFRFCSKIHFLLWLNFWCFGSWYRNWCLSVMIQVYSYADLKLTVEGEFSRAQDQFVCRKWWDSESDEAIPGVTRSSTCSIMAQIHSVHFWVCHYKSHWDAEALLHVPSLPGNSLSHIFTIGGCTNEWQ